MKTYCVVATIDRVRAWIATEKPYLTHCDYMSKNILLSSNEKVLESCYITGSSFMLPLMMEKEI